MPNSIQLIQKYGAENLDKKFMAEAKTSILERNSLLKFINAKTVLIPEITMSGLGNYSKENGFPKGSVNIAWEPHTLEMDRARTFSVDAMDDEETAGVAAGNIMGEFERLKSVPEADAYRLSKIYSKAKPTNIVAKSIAANTIISEFNDLIEKFDNDEVPTDEAVFFISTAVDKLLKSTSELERKITQIDYKNSDGITFKVRAYEGIPIIAVPKTRFKTAYVFGDDGFTPQTAIYELTEDEALVTGKKYYTRSGSAGAYVYTLVESPLVANIGTYYEITTPAAVDMHVMLVNFNSALPVKKHAPVRVFTPETNQTADAYKFDYRLYHGIFTPKNKVDGIAVITA